MKVRANKVPAQAKSYLTAGKIYDGEFLPPLGCIITDDEGDELILLLPGCRHLGSKAWEIVESSATEPSTIAEAIKRCEK